MDRVLVLFGPAQAGYDFGPGHPMQPVRLHLTMDLCRAAGLMDHPALETAAPGPLPDEVLTRTHAPALVRAIRDLGEDPLWSVGAEAMEFGIDPDTPAFHGMHDAAAAVCAAAHDGALAVWEGRAAHAFSPAGGLHHAQAGRAAGFCVYNDCSVAINALLDAGARRVAYVDVDVHHGDGTQWIHYGDPRVMTCSVHESGRFLYPGTGFVDELGHGAAAGTAVNVPMPPFAATEEWLMALDEVVIPLVEAFGPDAIVSQGGADSHHLDPLAHVQTTIDVFPAMWSRLHDLAHRACAGRWVGLGGGGYEPFCTVPRAWTLMLAEMLGVRLDGPLPPAWREHALRAGARVVSSGYRDDQAPDRSDAQRARARSEAERSIAEARAALFPRWGLAP